ELAYRGRGRFRVAVVSRGSCCDGRSARASREGSGKTLEPDRYFGRRRLPRYRKPDRMNLNAVRRASLDRKQILNRVRYRNAIKRLFEDPLPHVSISLRKPDCAA